MGEPLVSLFYQDVVGREEYRQEAGRGSVLLREEEVAPHLIFLLEGRLRLTLRKMDRRIHVHNSFEEKVPSPSLLSSFIPFFLSFPA